MKKHIIKILLLLFIIGTPIGGVSVYLKVKANINEKEQVINNLTNIVGEKENEIIIFNEKVNDLNEDIHILSTEKTKLEEEKTKIELDMNEIKKQKEIKEQRNEYLEKRTDELENELKKKKVNKPFNGKIIAVDIGHNAGVDSGSVTEWVSEDELTKEVGMELISMLEKDGFKVINVTPPANEVKSVTDSLNKRISKANEEKVNLFISVHFNSASNKSAQGTEVFYYNKTDETEKIGKSIIKNFTEYGFKDRGLKKANYYVLKNAQVPALLVECAFLVNVNDMTKYDPYKMAENILKGIKEVF